MNIELSDELCHNCGKKLSVGKDERIGVLCFDTGDESVGLEPEYYMECFECYKKAGD
jgi:hypothetical protein